MAITVMCCISRPVTSLRFRRTHGVQHFKWSSTLRRLFPTRTAAAAAAADADAEQRPRLKQLMPSSRDLKNTHTRSDACHDGGNNSFWLFFCK